MRKRIIFISLTFIILGIVGYIFIYKPFNNQIEVREEKIIENIDNISINTVSTDVNVVPSKDSTVYVELLGNSNEKYVPKLVTTTNNHQLKVDVEDYGENKWFNLSSLTLKVHVPQNLIDSFELNSISGNVAIQDVEAKRLKFNTNSGDMNFKYTLGDYTIETTSGNVEMHLKEISQPMTIDSESGNIQIKTNQKPTNATFTTKTLSGKVTIFDENHSHNIFGLGQNKIEIKSTSGNISIDTN